MKYDQCAQICPAETIEFIEGNYPVFFKEKCISCLCCSELCPESVIKAKNRDLIGVFD